MFRAMLEHAPVVQWSAAFFLPAAPGPVRSIRWEFEDSGKRKGEVSEILFGSRMVKKEDVEMRLRQAQTAVLNPQVPAEQFLGMSEDEMKNGVRGNDPLLFSKNVVCVDLEGPELTDLSFIDLPGTLVVISPCALNSSPAQVSFKMPQTMRSSS
jgi:hypothetical protein